MAEHTDYEKVFKHSRNFHVLGGVQSLLDWDQETLMPEDAAEGRAEQLKILAGLVHKERVSKKFSGPLSKLIDLKDGKILEHSLSDEQKAAVKEWRRGYIIDKALPLKFVESFTELTCIASEVWKKARQEKEVKSFLPYLKKVVDANRKKADYLGYHEHPYDALLDLYEPEMKTATVTTIFNQLKTKLLGLIKQLSTAEQIDDKPLFAQYPQDKQLAVCRKLLEKMGFTWKKERLDLSTHPFCSMSQPDDCRITTRTQDDFVFGCILTVLHEGGHALYDLGLPKSQFGSPLAEGISMGIHESQSRFWETRIGLSLPFWKFMLPIVKSELPGVYDHLQAEAVYRGVNKVAPTFIRVESDEVTYPIHIILRFELEKQLIEGTLKVKDLPEAWNALSQQYLGITPPNPALGCLQDVHWSMGAFGYFPTYALGNLFAAQIFDTFAKKFPDWETRVANGDLGFIREFLHNAVYKHGRRYRSQPLLEQITGKPFSADDYGNYLIKKYSALYNLQ